jgi:hypothetical protein
LIKQKCIFVNSSLAFVAAKVNIKEAKILYQAGVLVTPVIKKGNSGAGWVVRIDGTHKLSPMLETARGHIRVFKRLDAAVGVLFEIGFSEISVIRISEKA